MNALLALAGKDLRLLFRNRGALFFAFVWPAMMAIFFGLIFSGGDGKGGIAIVVVDEDGSDGAKRFIERLTAAEELKIKLAPRAEAEDLVRRGKFTAWVLLPAGFGEAWDNPFRGQGVQLELGVDPARRAEAGMLEGIVTRYAFEGFQKVFADPTAGRKSAQDALADLRQRAPGESPGTERFLGELDTFLGTQQAAESTAGGTTRSGFSPVTITRRDLTSAKEGPKSAFEFSFPQGILWGILGCTAVFGVGLVKERTSGTLARLRTTPLGRTRILAGRALATLVGIILVEAALMALGALVFSVRPISWGWLAVAGLASGIAFVGISLGLAVLGKTEESASGIAWAANLVMAMVGGGTVPLFAMPGWMRAIAQFSPASWVVLGFEGAIWRGFGAAEMAMPILLQVAIGVAMFAFGAWRFRD